MFVWFMEGKEMCSILFWTGSSSFMFNKNIWDIWLHMEREKEILLNNNNKIWRKTIPCCPIEVFNLTHAY